MDTAGMTTPLPAASAEVAAETQARTQRISIEQHSAVGMLWFVGWLFTVGLLHLPLGKALLALIVWPYYLGNALSGWTG